MSARPRVAASRAACVALAVLLALVLGPLAEAKGPTDKSRGKGHGEFDDGGAEEGANGDSEEDDPDVEDPHEEVVEEDPPPGDSEAATVAERTGAIPRPLPIALGPEAAPAASPANNPAEVDVAGDGDPDPPVSPLGMAGQIAGAFLRHVALIGIIALVAILVGAAAARK